MNLSSVFWHSSVFVAVVTSIWRLFCRCLCYCILVCHCFYEVINTFDFFKKMDFWIFTSAPCWINDSIISSSDNRVAPKRSFHYWFYNIIEILRNVLWSKAACSADSSDNSLYAFGFAPFSSKILVAFVFPVQNKILCSEWTNDYKFLLVFICPIIGISMSI